MDENLQQRCFTLPSQLWRSITFSQAEIKNSVKMYFSPCMDEDNKKKREKNRAKMKTLEAKLFDQNAKNWKRENRLFTLTVRMLEAGGSGKIEPVRMHSEVIEGFDSFSLA